MFSNRYCQPEVRSYKRAVLHVRIASVFVAPAGLRPFLRSLAGSLVRWPKPPGLDMFMSISSWGERDDNLPAQDPILTSPDVELHFGDDDVVAEAIMARVRPGDQLVLRCSDASPCVRAAGDVWEGVQLLPELYTRATFKSNGRPIPVARNRGK